MSAPKKRGRPSASSLSIAAPIEVVPRQRPPHDLNDEEVEVWAAVVSAEPADWFSPSTVPMLAQYCRHAVHAKRLGELIERILCDLRNPASIGEYLELLKAQRAESQIIKVLATAMRLTQQATRTHRGNSRTIASRKPWEA